MGCGSSSTQRVDSPGEAGEDDEVLKELYGEKIVYNKKTGDCILEKDISGDAGEQALACKPFKGAIMEPANHPPVNPSIPDEDYELEYVYGFRTYDTRQNLFYNSSGKAVYCVASLGIILDPDSNTQTFFGSGYSTKSTGQRYHDNDIISLGVSHDRTLAVTGQVGAKPLLNIWDAETGEFKTKYTLTQKNTRGIACCAFSADNKYVAFADKSEKYNVYIIDASNGSLISSESNSNQQVLDIAWSKKPGDYTVAFGGPKNIGFWTVGGKKKKGTGHSAQSFASITYSDNSTCYAGTFNGKIYVFNGTATTKNVSVHKGTVTAMCWSNGKLYTGGADYNLAIFDDNLKKLCSFNLGSSPRAIDVKDGNIIVGLRNGSICTVSESEKQITGYLMKSHHDGEVWGLDITEEGKVITSADDNKIMLWDPKERKNIQNGIINSKAGPKIKYGASSMTNMSDNQCARAVAINPKTSDVAIGINDGSVQIRDLSNLETAKKTLSAANRWIECMAYSPDGNYLAVGTHTSVVVVFSTDNYQNIGTLKGNSAAIISLDWSKDSTYIRTISLSYELLFYTVGNMQQDTSGASNTKDLEWATQTCKFGWLVQGIFEGDPDFSNVNHVNLSSDEKLIISGNDSSAVSIFRNPCLEGSKSKKLYGHSEHVTRVKFSSDDSYIFSVGGQDKTLMQWKKC